MTMIVKFNSKAFKVSGFEEASRVYSTVRDKSGKGASKWADGFVTDINGTTIARISYNGRVWPLEAWTVGQKPLYDNRA